MQLSMSWAWLLLECSYPFDKNVDSTAGEPARFGSGFHEVLAKSLRAGAKPMAADVLAAAKTWDVERSADEMFELVKAGRDTLLLWLRHNEFRVTWGLTPSRSLIEEAVGLVPGKSGRKIQPHDENHVYHGLTKGEIPGTLDLAIDTPDAPLLVLDHKTGEEDFSRPLEKAQLLGLVVALMRLTGRKDAVVAVLHARRRGMPKVYADRVKLSELKSFEQRLRIAQGRVGDGSLRPGPWCARCPARFICPARDAELLSKAGDVLTGLTAAGGALSNGGVKGTDLALRSSAVMTVEKKMGLLYSVVKKAEVMAGRARDEIKKAIIASEGRLVPETPEGESLIVREFEKENVSKSSIIEAMGARAGTRELEKLRAAGALKKTRVQQLWPERLPGRRG